MKKISYQNKSIVVIGIMTIIITVVFITFGKYSIDLGGKSQVVIAEPQTKIIHSGDGNISLDEGEIGEYIFSITNMDGGKASEISMTYTLSVETTSAAIGQQVKYSLFHCTENGTYNVNSDAIAVNQVMIDNQSDSQMKLSADNETTDYYILKIYPNKSGSFHFNVSVTSEQVD